MGKLEEERRGGEEQGREAEQDPLETEEVRLMMREMEVGREGSRREQEPTERASVEREAQSRPQPVRDAHRAAARAENLKGWICKDKAHHSCGSMLLRSNALKQRCAVYKIWFKTAMGTQRADAVNGYPSLNQVLVECSPVSASFARPRNLILRNRLIEVPQEPEADPIPYVAVSYTWDQNPEFVVWEGRRVTTQALMIANRFAQHTPHALWIDAICIHQDDVKAKEEELPKMADIYRGAQSVVCIISGVDVSTCEAVKRGVQIMGTEEYEDLVNAGDIYGCFLFATAGGNAAFEVMFQHRWWERAWTFQEATLNPRTFLVGDAGDVVSVGDVLKIAPVIRRRAASVAGPDGQTLTLGRPSAFWDSVSAMEMAASRPLTLEEAISCVWRRNASVRHDLVYSMVGVCGLSQLVVPSYEKDFSLVLRELFEAAISTGEYSWLTWSAAIKQADCDDGMGLAPTPDRVRASPYTSITSWSSAQVSTTDDIRRYDTGADTGLLLPYRSTGIIRTRSPVCSIFDTIDYLRKLEHTAEEIWDMLFGLQVGLIADIYKAIPDSDGIARVALDLALSMIQGKASRDTSMSDTVGTRPYTKGIAFTAYSLMAADSWSRSGVERLAVMSSQGGTVVIPIQEDGPADGETALADRIYLLPVDGSNKDTSRGFAFITGTGSHGIFKVRATAVVIRKPHTGRGKWQLRRIG